MSYVARSLYHIRFAVWPLVGLFALTGLLWGAPEIRRPDRQAVDTDPGDPDPVPHVVPQLYIEPIAGLTTVRHLAPHQTAIPLGTELRLFLSADESAEVIFTGATITSRDVTGVWATCTLVDVGALTIEAVADIPSGETYTRTCELDVVAISLEEIAATAITASVAPFDLDEYATNPETMEFFFGESIASFQPRPDGFLTSTGRRIRMTIDMSPPEFAPLMEWRVSGKHTRLGQGTKVIFDEPGVHTIAAGPPERSAYLSIETYQVSITSHHSGADNVEDGETVTFEAVTDPPGFEEDITWLSSTKYGTAAPVRGQGSTFTVQFTDTSGDQTDGSIFQWLGAKADNATFNQDQKTVRDTFCSTGEITIRIFADVLFDGQEEFEETMSLSSEGLSDAVVVRNAAPFDDCFDGTCDTECDEIPTEMMNLELAGSSETLGDLIVRVRDDRASDGGICCVDAGPAGNFLSGDSYFNLFVEIEVPGEGITVDTGDEPVRLQAEGITSLPPFGQDYFPQPAGNGVCGQPGGAQTVSLYLADTEIQVGELTHALHKPCCSVVIAGPTMICKGEDETFTATGTPGGGTCAWEAVYTGEGRVTINNPGNCSTTITGTETSSEVDDVTIIVTYTTPAGQECIDVANVTVVEVDLDIDSDNNGSIEESDDVIEENLPGKIICVNDDDDDNDGIADKDEDAGQSPTPGEDDLVQIDMATSIEPAGGKWKLTFPDKVKIWEFDDRSNGGFAPIVSGVPRDFPIPPFCYVEGLAPSDATGVTLTLAVIKADGTELCQDKVKLSVLALKRDVAGGAVQYDSLTDALRKVLPGQKMNLKAEVTLGGGVTVASYSWTLPGVTFENFTANQTTGTLTLLEAGDLDDQTVHYYWTDTGDARDVVCTVTLSNGVTKDIKAIFNVKKPTSTLTVVQGSTKLNPAGDRLGLYPDAGQAKGISWTGKVEMPAGFAAGAWNWVQVIKDGLHRTLAAGTVQVGNNFGEWVLDNTYPYEPAPYTMHPGTAGSYATGAASHTDSDTPSTPLAPATLQSKGTHDFFETTIMFLPPGEDSRYVPLRRTTWDWGGEVVNGAGGWGVVAGSLIQSHAEAETTVHPEWSANWAPFSWTGAAIRVTITPDTVTEGDGAIAGQASVGVPVNVVANLTVSLVSSDTSELTVPATVTILAGGNAVGFTFTVVDDNEQDGDKAVTVTASNANYSSGVDSVTVEDND